VSVNLHCQRATVTVAKPLADGGYVYSAFDAAGGEQMAQVVVSDASCLHFGASCRQYSPTLNDGKDIAALLACPGFEEAGSGLNAVQKVAHWFEYGDITAFLVVLAGTNPDTTALIIYVWPAHADCFADAATRIRHKFNQIGAALIGRLVAFADLDNDRPESL
jgi:hypothetical protein